jgi:hypothetical protein
MEETLWMEEKGRESDLIEGRLKDKGRVNDGLKMSTWYILLGCERKDNRGTDGGGHGITKARG